MKLVRLESESTLTQSQFTNNLSIPLVLGKNAQVALKSLSIQFAEPPIIIDNTNNTIYFSTGFENLGTPEKITIPSGNYDRYSLMEMIQELLNAMVSSYDPESPDQGFQWTTEVTGDSTAGYKAHIAFNRADNELITTANTTIIDGNSMVYDAPQFIKTAVDNNTYNAGLITDTYVNPGSWKISMTVQNQLGPQPEEIADSKWIFGIGNYFSSFQEGETGLLEDLYVCLYRNENGRYSYKKNYVMVDTNIDIEDGDTVTICKANLLGGLQSQVVYRITKGTTTTEFEGDIIQTSAVRTLGIGANNLLLKVGNDTGKIAFTNISFNPSPSIIENNGIYTKINASEVPYIIKNNNLTVDESTVTIDLHSENLKLLLGYQNKIMQKDAISYDFVGTNNISTNIFNNDIVVEIPELALDGYDQGLKQSRNIVMVITSGDLRNSQKSIGSETYELSYTETATFLFIGLKNTQTSITCPQLSIRVTSEGKILPLTGKMTALLLFRDETDK